MKKFLLVALIGAIMAVGMVLISCDTEPCGAGFCGKAGWECDTGCDKNTANKCFVACSD
jgi:hypothetical protein